MALDRNGNKINEYESYSYREKLVYGLFNHPECNCTKGMHSYHWTATLIFTLTIITASWASKIIDMINK